ncbi:hypothetical protein GDO78_000203 [Eleutherodactylus coqui]|uniref:Uncharacterized protein n=1 Tax=Eleutherodactylus coqui TaxID=57060 RepID=A0A8J6FP56_ELECQ|nr:hypothetical protein GDO78_000203 [Eleutherodactylus coqui]
MSMGGSPCISIFTVTTLRPTLIKLVKKLQHLNKSTIILCFSLIHCNIFERTTQNCIEESSSREVVFWKKKSSMHNGCQHSKFVTKNAKIK